MSSGKYLGRIICSDQFNCWPPELGARLSHFLLLILVPGPQVTLRALQALQPPQPPSNIIGRGGIVITLNLKCMSIKESLRFGK